MRRGGYKKDSYEVINCLNGDALKSFVVLDSALEYVRKQTKPPKKPSALAVWDNDTNSIRAFGIEGAIRWSRVCACAGTGCELCNYWGWQLDLCGSQI